MTYQGKLIEECLWRIFAEPFHCIHIHIKMWWWSTLMENRMSLSDSLSSQTHWRRFVMHLCRTFPLSIFISRYSDRLTLMENRMSLSNGLSSQTHWRRFLTHHCRTFRLYPHSYQVVVFDRLLWKIEWVYLMAYQAKLIEEGSWRIFVEPFLVFTFISKCGNQMRIKGLHE